MTTPDGRITFESHAGVGTIRVGDGTRHNALGLRHWQAITEIARRFASPDLLRVLVIEGAGQSFCGGSDIREWLEATQAAVDETFAAMQATCSAIEAVAVPTIARLRGVAAGAGCQLALACDVRLMADSARIGMPILRLGILTPPAFADRLRRLIGVERTRYLLYSGTLIDGDTAQSWGLVARCVADADLDAAVEELTRQIASAPAAAVLAAKAATRSGPDFRAVLSDADEAEQARTGQGRPHPTAVDWPSFQQAVRSFAERSARHHEPNPGPGEHSS